MRKLLLTIALLTVAGILFFQPFLVFSSDVFEAVRKNDIEAVKAYIANGGNVNVVDGDGSSLLMVPWSESMIKLLIDAKVDVNAKDKIGRTALIDAAMSGLGFNRAKLLVAAGADVNVMIDGMSALSFAAVFNNIDTVKLLIEAKADVDAHSNRWGITPLMWACDSGQIESIKLLIEAKADLGAKDCYGRTALMHAVGFFQKASIAPQFAAWRGQGIMKQKANAVKLLIDAGADVNAKDSVGMTVLNCAIMMGDAETIELLKNAGAKG
jgi:ankyrin repeat protein